MQSFVSAPRVRRILTVTAGLAVAVVALVVAARIPRTLSIFTIAAFIAFGVYPITSRLEAYMKRPAAIATVYLALIGAVIVVAFLVLPATAAQMQALVANAPDYVNATNTIVAHYQEMLRTRFGHTPLPGDLTTVQAYVASRLMSVLTFGFSSIGAIVVGTFTGVFVAVSAIILSFFFLSQGKEVTRGILSVMPLSKRDQTRVLMVEIVHIFGSFVAGQLVLCTITGVAIWAVCALLGFRFALLLGVLSGVLYAVPFVGMVVAQVLGALLAIPQGGVMVVWVSLVIFVVARVADNVLVPKIFSSSVGVSPIAVMFAVFAGGELFGIPGLVLGIPAAALIKLLYNFLVVPALAHSHYAESLRLESVVRDEKIRTETTSSDGTKLIVEVGEHTTSRRASGTAASLPEPGVAP